MQREVKFAGFGGQGILSAGKFYGEAGMEEGKEVAWVPSYGPEMRGGTAYCTVVIADHPIGSPIVNNPQDLVAMNRPSLEKFEPTIRAGGFILINSSLIPDRVKRKDVIEILVPCNEEAMKLGNNKAANMIILGAYAQCSGMLKLESIIDIVKTEFQRKPQFIDSNIACIMRGAEIAKREMENKN
ncbi:MAG: 2-oxoacid:acceptor oxidoreductase family protein [Candidatus Electryonea clarkiae]|nr:2-oxoacid:acceptor oxidoreductase family protein [Candidatus Electryonea clarkiae]MDP8286865.1 2-oxoacid:acceptor oxidoreductase family protein [Candidatus Electryonea clarkiae]